MRVGVLERPAAGPQPRTDRRPVADRIEHLLVGEPIERLPDRGCEPRLASLHQRMTGERSVPHRRQARLAIALLAVDDDELAERRGGGDPVGVIRRVAEAIEHHQRVGDCRENATEPILAVEPLCNESDRLVDRASASLGGEHRLAKPHQAVEQGEGVAGHRRCRRRDPVADGLGRLDKQLGDPDAVRVARLGAQRHQH